MTRTRVAIVGASGYAGEELLLGVREVLAGRSFMSASIVKRMNAEHGNGLG